MRLLALFCLGEFMAQYDGSIRINTSIEMKKAQIQLSTLENRIVKTSDKIASLRSKMDALKDAKIPTQEYENLQKELATATKELEKMVAQDSKFADIDKKIKSLSQSSAEYVAKMKEVAEQKIPTQEYSSATKEVEKLEKSLEDAYTRKERFLETGGDESGRAFKGMEYDIEKLEIKLRQAEQDMKNLVASGKAFTLGSDTEQYKNLSVKYAQVNHELEKQKGIHSEIAQKQADSVQKTIELKAQINQLAKEGKAFTLGSNTDEFAKMGQDLKYLENDYDVLLQKEDVLRKKIRQSTSGYKNFGDVAKKSFSAVGSLLKKADSAVDSFRKKIKEIAQKHLPLFRKEAEKTGASVSTFGNRLKSIFSGIFIFNAISAAVRKSLSGIREGFENFYNASNGFKASVDGMRSSLAQLKNALAGAFAPIVETAIPYIQTLINYINKTVSGIAQLIAALFGKKTYKKAKQVSIGGGTTDAGKDKKKVEQVEDSVNDLKDSAEDAEDAMNKMLSPLDKLNNLTSEKKEIKVDTGNIGDTGGNIADDITDGIGEGIEDIFEDIPIDKFWSDIADKVKDVFSKLFAPLKEAWNREGKFVMDSWKYALDEVWKLIKDVGRDFLIMWQQEATIKIFEDILHIIGDIGLAVGNLAQNFRAAWNENSVGLHIFENIRDIIGIIIGHIRNMADATVEWAQNIDFYPLLSAFNGFLESLEPVVDSISGILEDFYTKVLLPLGKWVLEKGLPELLQVFTDFNNKVDWESLRANLAEFWEHLEPFAETVGEGLIIFIEKVSGALANFINSQGFKDFLATVENWMDSVSPEDVADALEKIANALIGLGGALLGYEAIKGISGVLTIVKTFLSFFGTGGAAATIASVIGKIATALGTAATTIAGVIGEIVAAIGGIPTILGVVGGVVLGWNIGEWINEKLLGVDTPSFFEMMEGIKSSFEDGSWREALNLWGEDIKETWTGIWENVKATAIEKWENIKISLLEKWESIKETALEIWGVLKEGLSETWENIKTNAIEKWENIKSTLSEVIKSIADIVSEVVELVVKIIKGDWSGAWESAKGIVKNAADAIKGFVKGVIDKIKELGNKMKSVFDGNTNYGSGSQKTSGYSTRSVPSPYAANPAIAALSNAEIPGYATGQVIPRTMKQHLAVLGDNNRETEVVSPLSTIEQAVVNAMAKVNGSIGNNGGGSVTIEIPVTISGIGEIGRAVQQFDMEFFKQNGRHAFT